MRAVAPTVAIGNRNSALVVCSLGLCEHLPVWREMQRFSAARTRHTPDELWLVQHHPVFTLGLNGKPEHLLDPGDIPVARIDRGGQVTYHGPGQLLAYTLLDLNRLRMGPRRLVETLEQAVIDTLAHYGIGAQSRRDAPGVYVAGKKIAALGLRIRRGCCYHGLSFNVAMDLSPFRRINPCGYADLEVTQVADQGGPENVDEVAGALAARLELNLHFASSMASGQELHSSACRASSTLAG